MLPSNGYLSILALINFPFIILLVYSSATLHFKMVFFPTVYFLVLSNSLYFALFEYVYEKLWLLEAK